MKNILTQIFVTLGVIFLILLLIGTYFFITDPYNLKPLIFGSGPTKTQTSNNSNTGNTTQNTAQTGDSSTSTVTASGGFELSSAQRQALISLGIDPSAVPSSISREQEVCFVSVLGEARVGEIKAGAVPNAIEFYKAKACVQ